MQALLCQRKLTEAALRQKNKATGEITQRCPKSLEAEKLGGLRKVEQSGAKKLNTDQFHLCSSEFKTLQCIWERVN